MSCLRAHKGTDTQFLPELMQFIGSSPKDTASSSVASPAVKGSAQAENYRI